MEKIKINELCPYCRHPGSIHFTATDKIGYWAFCMDADCPCFIDLVDDESE